MDNDAAAKQFETLLAQLIDAYTLLRTVLLTLPIPMNLIERQADAPVEAIHALSRAWELLEYEHVSSTRRERLRSMITDWLTAYELAVVVQEAGPAPWRLRAIEACLNRFHSTSKYVATYLKG
jgi:hypothetical protein